MSSPVSNPLISLYYPINFRDIQASHVEPGIRELLGVAQSKINDLAASPGPRTYENTLDALENATVQLAHAMAVVGHLEGVITTPELRAAYNAVLPEVSAFFTNIYLNEGIWRILKEYAGTEEAGQLSGARKRFLQKTLDDFRRSGAGLDAAGKKELEEIEVELSRLTTRFSQNVLDATNAYELIIEDEAGLAGLPPSARDAARASAESKGRAGWRFTLQAPSYNAVLTYLDDAARREQLYRAHNSRCSDGEFGNEELILRILELRKRKAALLGYAQFADLVLEDRMAKSGAAARRFLDDLAARTRPAFVRETQELEEFRRKLEGPTAPPLQPWDIGYYAEKLRQERFSFDEEQLRPYFPFERVLEGVFTIAGRLFGIQVVEEKESPTWHPEARHFRVLDEHRECVAHFYLDYFPRESKRGGAWMDSLYHQGWTPYGMVPHVGVMCGNLNPPLAGKPALLTHREVETVFHEFGHLLHLCLSRVGIRSLAGTNVAWDFVELPSQIMENWCWEREALDLFARHYETGDLIPEGLFQNVKRARTFRSATQQMRQLSMALLDLALHMEYDPARDGGLFEYARRLQQNFAPSPFPADYAMLASFSHLFASPVGYGSGYYSYKWAEVLDADAFSRFAREGIFNPVTGAQFRECVLARGNGEDPGVLYREFMGRDPDPDALLRRSGLLA